MDDDVISVANLIDLILNDPIRYHVVQSALNTSNHPEISSKLHSISSPSVFKDLLLEAKNASPSPPQSLLQEYSSPFKERGGKSGSPWKEKNQASSSSSSPSPSPSAWREYKLDPDEEDEPRSAAPSNSLYDDPYLYDDSVDDWYLSFAFLLHLKLKFFSFLLLSVIQTKRD